MLKARSVEEVDNLTDLVEQALDEVGSEMDPIRLAAIFAAHMDTMPSEWLARLCAERVNELAQVSIQAGIYSDIIGARQIYGQRLADDLSHALVELSIEDGTVDGEDDELTPKPTTRKVGLC
jgi:hypothetical protein